MEQQLELNEHNKKEYPPMHTAEHILNQTMVRMFGCERSKNSHIERKKSKCDYFIQKVPDETIIADIEQCVNSVINQNLPVVVSYVNRDQAPDSIDLSKLPNDVSDTLRLVSIGDYDICACIGDHVENTSQVGTFKIISYDYSDNRLRLRFKLLNNS